MSAMETSKNVAVQGGTFGLGAAVVATQLGLALSTGGALLLLDTLGGAKQVGQQMLTTIRDVEKVVEEKIWNAIAEGQRVAQIPLDKIAESTNAFLDVISVLMERSLGIPVEEHPERSIKERVMVLARKIVEAVNNKVFGDGTRVESAIEYLHDLDKNLGESEDIYQVRDEGSLFNPLLSALAKSPIGTMLTVDPVSISAGTLLFSFLTYAVDFLSLG
ncbi:hypothetical protein TELCIR_13393 [Teladorsagia circumcincta]|uniref:Uncharacterized protein n=1 Tax=Teladorsagia circumcincta TaxID=45464 RepID=A0A2G9U481_TELCI|nr:hypothetical protein TELCIR_13393 [Teladorsagia circumcincta]